MARRSRSMKEDTTLDQDGFNADQAPSPGYEYESQSERIHRSPNHKPTKEAQQVQVNRRLNKFQPARYRNDETQSSALQPLNRGASEQSSLARPVSRMRDQDQSTEELSLSGETESDQLQKRDEESGLKLRLDLNLDIEVELKAKIYGDITLSLLK